MTDVEHLAVSEPAAPHQPARPDYFTSPAPLGPAVHPGFPGHPGFSGSLSPRSPILRWLRPNFPWLAPRSLVLLTALSLVVGGALVVRSALRSVTSPPSVSTPVVQSPLHQLKGQMEESRGIESLLVMLPKGAERDATVVRLQLQHQMIDSWINGNSQWITTTFGMKALIELREANQAWRELQLRVVQTEVVSDRTGLANESRQLLTGPSAAAYQQMVQLVDTLTSTQPS